MLTVLNDASLKCFLIGFYIFGCKLIKRFLIRTHSEKSLFKTQNKILTLNWVGCLRSKILRWHAFWTLRPTKREGVRRPKIILIINAGKRGGGGLNSHVYNLAFLPPSQTRVSLKFSTLYPDPFGLHVLKDD